MPKRKYRKGGRKVKGAPRAKAGSRFIAIKSSRPGVWHFSRIKKRRK